MRTVIAVMVTGLATIPLTTLAQRDTPCAWVVWVKRSLALPTERPLVEWDAPDASPDRSSCLQLRQRLWGAYRNSAAGPVVSVEVGEFNSDGKPDLVIATLGEYPFAADRSVSVLLGIGDGTFQAPYRVADSGFPVVGDLNGDGKRDLAIALANFSDRHVGVLEKAALADFVAPVLP